MSAEIIHGECEAVLPTLAGRTIAAVVCDPPYGDAHDTDYRRFTGGSVRKGGDAHPRHAYKPVHGDAAPFDPTPLLGLAPRVVLFGANRFSDRLPCGSWLVWDKRTPTGSKGVMSDAEVAWDSHGRGVYIFAHTWDGFNRASEYRQRYHPTQKPVALMRWVLERLRLPTGALVLDPYAGSGPVGVACVELGLSYIGIEREADYVATARRRIAAAQAQPSLLEMPA